ncbi:hypothetical protein KDA_58270 [Dictyobacter alpinus]|uniref:Uncharacterized protein n=1 Tax=Dictyobacter alpinus TaxID=2014873 RepID=A0A402BFW5_9CHLR|nr:group III truncated hemoglobin [Dictyobacter alpinus]GCE30311.1 hypothetical protein KDA_57950 [Dictyobacter alpinus]GCE30343.1 hypothetical protein KDA_58270 [Dictyobacter alpinus]
MPNKQDISNRADIATIVSAFYQKAMQDPAIGPFFTEIAAIDLEEHLPVMYDFWENLLFQTGGYRGGMMYKHIMLDRQQHLTKEHFARWLELFEAEVDTHFTGPMAEDMKKRARSIIPSMQLKMRPTMLPLTERR